MNLLRRTAASSLVLAVLHSSLLSVLATDQICFVNMTAYGIEFEAYSITNSSSVILSDDQTLLAGCTTGEIVFSCQGDGVFNYSAPQTTRAPVQCSDTGDWMLSVPQQSPVTFTSLASCLALTTTVTTTDITTTETTTDATTTIASTTTTEQTTTTVPSTPTYTTEVTTTTQPTVTTEASTIIITQELTTETLLSTTTMASTSNTGISSTTLESSAATAASTAAASDTSTVAGGSGSGEAANTTATAGDGGEPTDEDNSTYPIYGTNTQDAYPAGCVGLASFQVVLD